MGSKNIMFLTPGKKLPYIIIVVLLFFIYKTITFFWNNIYFSFGIATVFYVWLFDLYSQD